MALTTLDFERAGTRQRATQAERELANLTSNLQLEQSHLKRTSREVVDVTGTLVKAKTLAARLRNAAAERRVELIQAELDGLLRREAVGQRLVKSLEDQIAVFLATGEPTNKQLIDGLTEFENIEREVAAL